MKEITIKFFFATFIFKVTQSSPQTPSSQYEQAGGVQSLFFAGGAVLPGSI